MNIRCPQCQTQYRNIPENFRHKKVRCKKCSFRFKADDRIGTGLPQETRLVQNSELAEKIDFPQETRLVEPAEINPEKSLPSSISTLARLLGKGSEHLLQHRQFQQQKVSDWQTGDVILDLYEVKSLLGEGQFGKVYQVRHRNWNMDLALKTPKPKALSSGAQNIIKEAKTWVNLALHPNIVNCYYVRTIDGIPQIFSEYVNGGDLKQLINNKTLYRGHQEQVIPRILDIAIQFAWGLYFAHEQGLIHQDIKPANVMFSISGVVKITDFGLAKISSGATDKQPETITGVGMTPAYASPEQLAGKTLTHRTDIWSWAVCVLEMLLGYCSWEAGAAAAGVLEAYLKQQLDEQPVIPGIPAELEQILSQCFEEQESLRPENMLQVAQELISVYRHQTGQAYPRSVPQTGSETASSYNNQAISLVDIGRTKEAVKLWQKALAIEPQHFESIYNQALLQWQVQGLEENILFEKIHTLFNTIPDKASRENVLARLYLHFGQFDNALKILNNGQIRFSSLPSVVNEAQSIELGLALCARYRRVRNSQRWQYIADCLQDVVTGKTDDPYAITAYTLALHKSGQKKIAAEFYSMIRDSGILPVGFNQVVNLFLPGYEMLYQLPVKNSPLAAFANNDECIIYTQANNIIVWSLKAAKQVQCLSGHRVAITALKYVPEQDLIISGSRQGNIRVWDIKESCQVNVWFAHKSAINALDLSPCGRYLVSAAQENTLCLWDIEQGTQIKSFYGEGHDAIINDVRFSPCGNMLLSASADKILRVWDVRDGKTISILRGHEYSVNRALWIDEQTLVSAARDKTLRLWQVEKTSGDKIAPYKILKGHQGAVDTLCVSRKKFYGVSGGSDGQVRYWDLKTGRSLILHQFEGPVVDVCLDTSERFVLVMTQKGLAIVETENPFRYQATFLFSLPESAQKVDQLHGQYLKQVQKASFKQQQHQYIEASHELEQARKIEAYTRDQLAYNSWSSLYLKLPRTSVKDVWLDKEKLSLQQDNSLQTEVNSQSNRYSRRITSICCSNQSEWFYTSDQAGAIIQWQRESFKNSLVVQAGKPVSSIKPGNDDASLLYACEKDIYLIDIGSGEILSSFNHHDADVNSFVLTPDGRFVISSDSRGGCFLWRLLTGEMMADFSDKNNIISTITIAPDGQHFICAYRNNNRLELRDVQTGSVYSERDEHVKPVTSLAISLDGRLILSAGTDGVLRLWKFNSSQNKSLRVFNGHTRRVYQVVMDDQAKIAVSISEDRSLKVWDLHNGKCQYTYSIADADFSCVTITPDAKYIIAGKTDGGLLSWCLDWELDQNHYQGWQSGADIYIRNYLLSRKLGRLPKETSNLVNLLSRAGFGYLDRDEIARRLSEIKDDMLQQKILTGSIRATGSQLSDKPKKNNKKLLSLVAMLVMVILLLVLFSPNKQTDEAEPVNDVIVLNEPEQQTVTRMLAIGAGLARLNRKQRIVNNRIDVSYLIFPDDLDKLKNWLNIEPSMQVDAWGQPFKYTGIKNGAFKGRIVLRSAGQDQQYKTRDDLLLNGYPYQSSLAIRKANTTIIRLADIADIEAFSLQDEPVNEDLDSADTVTATDTEVEFADNFTEAVELESDTFNNEQSSVTDMDVSEGLEVDIKLNTDHMTEIQE